MTDPLNPKYIPLTKQARFAEAARLVVDKGWTQEKAAQEVGVSRPRLSPYVAALRDKRNARIAEAVSKQAVSPVGLQEKRRVPDFWTFFDMYFGHWICPDCDIHHEPKEFHRELIQLDEDPTRHQVIANLPPFHAKTFYVTILKTVHRIIEDPNIRNILISKSDDFARTFLKSIDDILTKTELYGDGPNLITDWGPFKPDDRSSVWNQNQIYVCGRTSAEKDPTIQVLGIRGQLYGRRADRIVGDDIADTENQANAEQVQKQLKWLLKMGASRLGKKGKLYVIGTRIQPGDIYSFLRKLAGWYVIAYSAILDMENEEVLWPEHAPFDYVLQHKSNLSAADFQLIWQNIEGVGETTSWNEEMIEMAKDPTRMLGHFLPGWRLIAGLDLAGGGKGSGYTAGILQGVDLRTRRRYLVDVFNVKSMRPPALKQQILDWNDIYPIYSWKVENNGLQSNLVQYNTEIVEELASRGTRVEGHHTGSNKWDPQFGVESCAPLWSANMVSVPWGNAPTIHAFQPFMDQILGFPLVVPFDLAMAYWFSELGVRELLDRDHLPMFDGRRHVPQRIKRRRRIVNLRTGEVESVPLAAQRPGVKALGIGQMGDPRLLSGRMMPHEEALEETEDAEETHFVNVQKSHRRAA